MKRIALFLASVCLIGLFGVFSACNESNDRSSYETVPVLQDTRPETEQMNTFTTLNGNEVTYNMNTRRIVAVACAGDLAAFGIRPLAVSGYTITEGYESFFEGVELLEENQPFDPEEILSYRPELILVNQLMDQRNIERLEEIAPVIPLWRESYDFEQRLSYIGEIFGLTENAQTLIEFAEATQKEALEEIRALGIENKTVSVFYYGNNGVSVPPMDYWYFNKILYDYLGLKQLDVTKEFLDDPNNTPFSPISNEVLRRYEGDIVIYADVMSSVFGAGPSVPEQLTLNPGWRSLEAVQEDRVGLLDGMLYADKDVLYLRAQYDGILAALRQGMAE